LAGVRGSAKVHHSKSPFYRERERERERCQGEIGEEGKRGGRGACIYGRDSVRVMGGEKREHVWGEL